MKRCLLFFILFILWPVMSFSASCRPAPLPPNPTVDQIMKHWYDIKFTRFADNVIYDECKVVMVDRSGFKREKISVRKRIILHGKHGYDYKDLVMITYPEYTKGLAVLTWAYTDIHKQNDIWLWLPSMKKVRKVSQSEEDDSFLGTEFTVEDVSTRRYGYETYQLLGEERFKGYTCRYNKKTYFAGTPCYKIKAVPKRKNWYYAYRILWIDKKTGVDIFEEFYDKRGRKFKEIFHYLDTPENGCWTSRIWEVYNYRTGHTDTIIISPARYNTGLKERDFSPRILERMEW